MFELMQFGVLTREDKLLHTGVQMKVNFKLSWLATDARTWLWRVVPIVFVLIAKIWRQWQSEVIGRTWWLDVSLLVGWVLGWALAEADHLIYATMCNPQELTCQRVKAEIDKRQWGKAWQMLQETKLERTRLPVRNILTGFVMTGVGIWIVTSSGSLLASGIVFGFGIRLFSEILFDADYKKWYWVFAREFTDTEHRSLMAAWAAGLAWQWLALMRG